MYDNSIPEQKRIVIVGGGISGLACAYRLINIHGVNSSDIIVLEAHTALGGRVKQFDGFLPDNHRVELGAELLHGDKTEMINLILENVSLKSGELTSGIEQRDVNNNMIPSTGVSNDTIKEAELMKRDDLLLESFAWAQGDGGPSEREINGGYGLYYLGKEKRLLKYNELDPEIEYAHECLWSIPDVNIKEQLQLTQQRKDILKLDQNTGGVITLRDYLENCNIIPRVINLIDAGYANTIGGTIDCIPLHGAKHLEIGWDKESEDGDFRLLHPRSLQHVIDILTR